MGHFLLITILLIKRQFTAALKINMYFSIDHGKSVLLQCFALDNMTPCLTGSIYWAILLVGDRIIMLDKYLNIQTHHFPYSMPEEVTLQDGHWVNWYEMGEVTTNTQFRGISWMIFSFRIFWAEKILCAFPWKIFLANLCIWTMGSYELRSPCLYVCD